MNQPFKIGKYYVRALSRRKAIILLRKRIGLEKMKELAKSEADIKAVLRVAREKI